MDSDWGEDGAGEAAAAVVAKAPSIALQQALNKRKLAGVSSSPPPPSKRAKLTSSTHVARPASAPAALAKSPAQKRKADDRQTGEPGEPTPIAIAKRSKRESATVAKIKRPAPPVVGDALRGAMQACSIDRAPPPPPPPAAARAPTSQMASKAQKRLQGARFRMLNEMLYTTTGSHAFKMFQANPELFSVYHDGFKTQVEHWPVNPVRKIIEHIKSLPRKLVVADFGCGEAELAASVPNTVHSFDLVAHNARVTPCDIAHVPLAERSVDVGVFCLSLMGTNFSAFLLEAHRVLRVQGRLLIAEVKSRIVDLNQFVDLIERVGFDFAAKDESNQMFVSLEFRKRAVQPAQSGQHGISEEEAARLLQPCIYKRR